MVNLSLKSAAMSQSTRRREDMTQGLRRRADYFCILSLQGLPFCIVFLLRQGLDAKGDK
jgi:hypothetical protein